MKCFFPSSIILFFKVLIYVDILNFYFSVLGNQKKKKIFQKKEISFYFLLLIIDDHFSKTVEKNISSSASFSTSFILLFRIVQNLTFYTTGF